MIRKESLIVGVDVGGTNTRIALASVEQPDRILVRDSFETPVREGPDYTVELLAERLDVTLQKIDASWDGLAGMGCTVPGLTDAASGRAVFVTNLQGWDNYPIAQRLNQKFGVPVTVENDVNAAAYGEYIYGSGKGCHSIVYLTVSTGVAAGIIVEGRLLRGFNHGAGELGYFIPDPRHLDKDWSPNGCLELTSAGIGLAREWAKSRGESSDDSSAVDVFDAAEKGEVIAQKIVQNAANSLALAAIGVCTTIDPERLILGGSIVQHQPMVANRIREVLQKTMPHSPTILLSSFHGDAPIIGAIVLALEIYRKGSIHTKTL